MPDGICIARRKVFFSGTFNFFRQPNFLDNQKKNKKKRYTSSYIALYWPLRPPPPPLGGPDYTWLLGGNVKWFLFAEIGPTICCPLPDEASFLQNGRGVSPPHTPPGVSALCIGSFISHCRYIKYLRLSFFC